MAPHNTHNCVLNLYSSLCVFDLIAQSLFAHYPKLDMRQMKNFKCVVWLTTICVLYLHVAEYARRSVCYAYIIRA